MSQEVVEKKAMWNRIDKSAVILGIVASVVTIILFIEQSKTLPQVTDMLSVALLKLVLATLILLLVAICLWRQNVLKKQIEDHINSTAPSLLNSETFIIEITHTEIQWRKKRGGELYSLLNEEAVPEDATLFLHIRAAITARPSRLIDKVELDLAKHRLIEGEWKRERITEREVFLYFTIPSIISFGKHPTQLILGTREEGKGVIEKKSPVFDVVIARSLHDFQAFSSIS